MKTIDLSLVALKLTEILKLAGKDNLILRTPKGQEFVVAEIDDFAHEVALVRQNAELMKFLAKRFKEPGKYTLNQVRKSRDH